MRSMQELRDRIDTAGNWIQQLIETFRELRNEIPSIDRERITDPTKVRRALRRAVRSVIQAGKEQLGKLKDAIEELHNAIGTITADRMPEMRNVFRSIGEWWWDLRNSIRSINLDRNMEWLIDIGQNARNAIRNMGNLTVDKVAEIIAGLGVPELVLTVLMTVSPWYGAAAMTSSLAVLGGPLGMAGGIALLLVLALIARALAKFGFEKVFGAVLLKLIENGKTHREILEKINDYPISNELKQKLTRLIEESLIDNNHQEAIDEQCNS